MLSLVKMRLLMSPVCPTSVCKHPPVVLSHMQILQSADAVATFRPSGENATLRRVYGQQRLGFKFLN
jgi:hypothetical protein